MFLVVKRTEILIFSHSSQRCKYVVKVVTRWSIFKDFFFKETLCVMVLYFISCNDELFVFSY